MVSAISLCLLALGLTSASSQLLSSDSDTVDVPVSERRTFKHGKPVKFLPLIKKHKKFGGFIPHVYTKGPYIEGPIIHEGPRPHYKVHKFHGIEIKPYDDFTFSTPEPIIETHSIEPSSEDYAPNYSYDHSSHSSNVLFYPAHTKPFSSHSSHDFEPLPPPKPVFSFVPAPSFSHIPILPITIARPAQNPIFSPLPASLPPQPIFTSVPVKFQSPPILPAISVVPALPALPALPAPSPAPVFSPAPVKFQPPILPPISTPQNVFSPVTVKIPAPVLPSVATPTPAPVFSTVTPTPIPAFSPPQVSLPPSQFSLPSITAFPPPVPAFSSSSPTPEPEYHYPPSGTPIPSYIKDISLGNVEIKDSPVPTFETPKYEEVTPAPIDDGSKHLEHVVGGIKPESGFFQKIKGWKADKANAALSHFTNFKPKPFFQSPISFSHVPNKVPLDITPQLPANPTLQFPGPIHPLPLAQTPSFFPPAPFFSGAKYESFPPNNIESPLLHNSYGVPISHDAYAPHDRLSSAASEEEPAVAPAPTDKKQPNEIQQQAQLQPTQIIPQQHPIYVPEQKQTETEDNKTNEEVIPESDEYKQPNEPNLDEVIINTSVNSKP